MHEVVGQAGATRSVKPGRLPPLWLVWIGVAAFLTLVVWPMIATFKTQDPDDWMRLLQVRDWVDGQGWFDNRQYRFDPPRGADMHWVRLVDLPIAFFLVLFKQVLAERAAETAAMTIVPLLTLLATMYVMRAVMRQIGASPSAQLAAAALIPAFPLLLTNYAPMRIDHHAWQAFGALTVAWGMVKDSWRHALIAGFAAAAWLMISLEGMALCAVFCGLFALRYWLWARRQHEAFLLGLGVGLPLLFAIFRPLSELPRAMSDLPSWPHFLAFGGGAFVAALSRVLPGQHRRVGRCLSLLPIGAVAAAALFIPLGWRVVQPLALDPYLKAHWFDNMAESASLPRQTLSVAAMTLWTIAIALVGTVVAWRSATDARIREQRGFLAAATIAAGLVSLLIMRAGLTAQLLTVPFAAMLIVRWWPHVRALASPVPRVAATLALIGLATPVFVSAIFKPVDRGSALTVVQAPSNAASADCDFDRLNALPPAHLFVTLDRGPEVLARTRHTAVMSGYHRNQTKMIEVMKGFAAPLPDGEAIIRHNHAAYVVACTGSADLWVAANAGTDNLADRILADRPPAWLTPVPGFAEGPLRVYAVR